MDHRALKKDVFFLLKLIVSQKREPIMPNSLLCKEHLLSKKLKAGAILTEITQILTRFGTTLICLYCCVQVALGDGSHEARQRRRRSSFQGILAPLRRYRVLCLEGNNFSDFQMYLNSGLPSILIVFWYIIHQGMPEFVFANRSGLEMFETTSNSLQDLNWEKTLNENDCKLSYATFTQVLQQVIVLFT